MKKMGFDSEWVDSLIKSVTTISYSVVFNGHIGETFIPSKRLRQGDPLSPFLFLFYGEVKASRSGLQVSHLLFTDDCFLFGEAIERRANSLKQILHEYKICSGQSVNYTKSTIFSALIRRRGTEE
ncbi:reverse transcriptase [Gossypium australe]|uniref:Reverse transcriptase n=1 Tax=Gossypium australe TaxID=47621 RepID=A0A5B6WZ54_9ROSI|nr:reverse transcriptase [Gossypium australe]